MQKGLIFLLQIIVMAFAECDPNTFNTCINDMNSCVTGISTQSQACSCLATYFNCLGQQTVDCSSDVTNIIKASCNQISASYSSVCSFDGDCCQDFSCQVVSQTTTTTGKPSGNTCNLQDMQENRANHVCAGFGIEQFLDIKHCHKFDDAYYYAELPCLKSKKVNPPTPAWKDAADKCNEAQRCCKIDSNAAANAFQKNQKECLAECYARCKQANPDKDCACAFDVSRPQALGFYWPLILDATCTCSAYGPGVLDADFDPFNLEEVNELLLSDNSTVDYGSVDVHSTASVFSLCYLLLFWAFLVC